MNGRLWLLGLSFASLGVLTPRWGESQAPAPYPALGEEVHVAYSAPSGCPGEAAFLSEVRKRIGASLETQRGGPTRTIDVTVTKTLGQYRARIEFTDPEGRPIARSIRGERCETVVVGIALVTALAIEARVDELMSGSESMSSTKLPQLPNTPPAPSSSKPGGPNIGFAVRAGVATGVGPEPALGLGGFFDIAIGPTRIALGVDSFHTETLQSGRRATFDLLAARADVCPLVLFDSVRKKPTFAFALRACAVLSAGRLHGAGHVAPPLVETATEGAHLTVDVVFLDLQLVGLIPLNRHRFYFRSPAGDATFHTVPPLSAGASIALGLRFR
jgi:hypothetical protein